MAFNTKGFLKSVAGTAANLGSGSATTKSGGGSGRSKVGVTVGNALKTGFSFGKKKKKQAIDDEAGDYA